MCCGLRSDEDQLQYYPFIDVRVLKGQKEMKGKTIKISQDKAKEILTCLGILADRTDSKFTKDSAAKGYLYLLKKLEKGE